MKPGNPFAACRHLKSLFFGGSLTCASSNFYNWQADDPTKKTFHIALTKAKSIKVAPSSAWKIANSNWMKGRGLCQYFIKFKRFDLTTKESKKIDKMHTLPNYKWHWLVEEVVKLKDPFELAGVENLGYLRSKLTPEKIHELNEMEVEVRLCSPHSHSASIHVNAERGKICVPKNSPRVEKVISVPYPCVPTFGMKGIVLLFIPSSF